jgi:Holliday junction resolvase RusA-like endonuclease
MIVLDLPFPPSANNMHTVIRGRKALSKSYIAWKSEAAWAAKLAKVGRVAGPVEVAIEIVAPDRRRRDCDNAIKPVVDALVSARLIDGDDARFVRKVSSEWVSVGPACRVTIRPIERT